MLLLFAMSDRVSVCLSLLQKFLISIFSVFFATSNTHKMTRRQYACQSMSAFVRAKTENLHIRNRFKLASFCCDTYIKIAQVEYESEALDDSGPR